MSMMEGVNFFLGSSNQTNGREYFSINPRSSSDVIEGYVEIPNHQDVRVNGDPSSPRTMKPAPWIALNIEKILRPTLLEVVSVFFRTLENRYVHEGRTIDPSFYNDLSDDLVAKFTAIGFDCLLSLDEQICPRFIFEFYKTLKLERDYNNLFLIQSIINNHHLNLSLAQFVKLTHLPNKGICIYFDAWGLDELKKTLEQIEPYNSRLPALDDI
ncbi:hypothetical protein Tco_0899108 [Tanacetum coccineum]